jgi:hypothetical protein
VRGAYLNYYRWMLAALTVRRQELEARDAFLVVAGLIGTPAYVWAVLQVPLLVLLLPGVVLLYALAQFATARLAAVVGGGIFIFQSTGTGSRYVYIAVVLVCVAASLLRMPTIMSRHPEIRAFLPVLLGGCTAILAMCLISVVVSTHNGTRLSDWLSSALPYILLGLLPVVGLDAAAESPRAIRAILLLVSLIAPLAFMTDWLNRRGVSALGFGRFAFASIPLCALAFGLALGRLASRRPRSWLWLFMAIYAPLAVLLTGTRSSIAIVGGALGAIGASRKLRLPAWQVLAVTATVGAGMYYLVLALGPHLVDSAGFYRERFASLSALWQQGASSIDSDSSYQGRSYESYVALQAFHAHPLFGIGPNQDQSLGFKALDTPYATLLRFGYMGVLGLSLFVCSWFISIRALRQRAGYTWAMTTGRVFAVAMLCYLPLSALFDDKGLPLAVCLLAALIPSESRALLARGAVTEHPPVVTTGAALRSRAVVGPR